jgi:hypothetical protein
MTERTKKILYILGFLAVVILMALALYFVFFRPTPPPTVVTPTPEFPGGLTPAQPGVQPGIPGEEEPGVLTPAPGIVVPPTPGVISPAQISSVAVGGPVVSQKIVAADSAFSTINSNGNSLNYYDQTTGLFTKVDEFGVKELLSSKVFRDVQNVSWAPTADKAVLEFPDGSNIIYNFETEQSYTLPRQFEDFSFSPDSNQIAAKDLKLNKEDRWLVIVDDTGQNKKLTEHLGENEDRVTVKWNPNDLIIATTAKSIDRDRAEVLLLGKNNERFSRMIVQGRDMRYQYSENGNRMAYSVYNTLSSYLPTLWITSTDINNVDSNRINTGLNTWADKCAFLGNTDIYCAVPKEIGAYSGILPSENTSDDVIYHINANSGTSELIAEPLFGTRIGQLTVSKDGENLYYTDSRTGSINKINLR